MSLIGVAILAFLLTYKYIIYPAFFSPLSKLPTANPLCLFTSKWFDRQREQRRELETLFTAHAKYGPIVRLGPQEVSVASLEGLRQIYTAGLEKHPWYETKFYNYGVPNLVSTLDRKTHSTQKRMITSLYAKSYIQHSSDVHTLSTRIVFDRFLPLLQKWADNKEHVNVVELFQWTGIDFMSAYIFGTANSTNFLEDKEGRERYFEEWAMIRESDDTSEKKIMEGLCMKMCNAAISGQSRYDQTDGTNPVVFLKMYSQMLEKEKAEGGRHPQIDLVTRCSSEMLDHIIAAHETTGITLTYVLYRLSLNPTLQANVQSELLTLEPRVKLGMGQCELPASDRIDGLPLLNAVLQETLRLHAAAPGRQPRIVPKGGIILHGHDIPAGTTVSCNAYSLHRHEEAFPHPFEWIPQRWMPSNDGSSVKGPFPGTEVTRRWFWAFGSGGRM